MKWPIIESSDHALVEISGTELINFASNDYLGLTQNGKLKQVISNGILDHGIGSTGSRRLSGNHRLFLEAESVIARWVGKESGVLFNSGYQMNSSIFSAITSNSTLIITDKYSHASLIDGIQASKAKGIRFRHNDTEHLAQLLKKYAHQYSDVLIVCESIYSMDGDTAPIQKIVALKHQYNARLLVDEAHSIGLFGTNGNGWINHHGLIDEVDILLVPFGKAFGLSGAMLLANQSIVATIKAKCRGYIYTTALPLAMAIGIRSACNIIESSGKLRLKLDQNIQLFKSIIKTHSSTQIQPIIIGNNHQASHFENQLITLGYFVRAVHHPTVPKGQSRIRITITSHHTSEQITAFAYHVKKILESDRIAS